MLLNLGLKTDGTPLPALGLGEPAVYRPDIARQDQISSSRNEGRTPRRYFGRRTLSRPVREYNQLNTSAATFGRASLVPSSPPRAVEI